MTAPKWGPIPTRYKGILFRSKLEADWARTFDALGIEWRYEVEGQYYGDQFYLADFWLTRSSQIVEVKGVFQPNDCRKIAAFLSNTPPRRLTGDECPDIGIVACEPNGVFRGWVRDRYPLDISILELSRRASRDIRLFQCWECRGWWFADESMSWRCQCCGVQNGNKHLLSDYGSPLLGFPMSPRPRGADDLLALD